ncbi:MAG TPA: O-antigen ligase family protein [Myxococcota bacterium]|nr:O-antigen ligase family protein [Myxococcota bacterium]
MIETAFDYLQFPYAFLAIIVIGLLLWRPLAGLLLLVAMYPMDPYSPRLPVPGINTETVLLGLAFAVTTLRFGPRLPPLRYSAPVVGFVAMTLLAFVIAIPWARNAETQTGVNALWFIFKFWKSITFSALLFFCSYWWFKRPKDRIWLLEAISVGVLISCAAGLADAIFGITVTSEDGRASGLQGDPNAMAEAVGSMMFVSLYLALYVREIGWFRRAVHGFVYLFSLGMVVISLSRGNWVALIAAHFVFFLFFSRALLIGGVVAVLMIGTVAYPLLPQVIRDRIELTTHASNSVYGVSWASGFESSTATRIVFTKIGIDMFAHSPIWGNGLNAFFLRTREFGGKYGIFDNKDPHNLVIKVAAEAGLIGLGTFAWLVVAVSVLGWQLWRSGSKEYRLGGILLASGVHIFVASLTTDSFLYAKQISAYFWVLYAASARAYVERNAVSEVRALAVAVPRWRRFSQRTATAASQL